MLLPPGLPITGRGPPLNLGKKDVPLTLATLQSPLRRETRSVWEMIRKIMAKPHRSSSPPFAVFPLENSQVFILMTVEWYISSFCVCRPNFSDGQHDSREDGHYVPTGRTRGAIPSLIKHTRSASFTEGNSISSRRRCLTGGKCLS